MRTEPQRPAGPPLSVAVRAVAPTQLLVTWSPPLAELRHGAVQGFNVGYRIATSATGGGGYNFSSVTGDGEDGSGEMLLSGLAKYTRYVVVAQAFNEVGPGPLSEPATSQTMEDGKSIIPQRIGRFSCAN